MSQYKQIQPSLGVMRIAVGVLLLSSWGGSAIAADPGTYYLSKGEREAIAAPTRDYVAGDPEFVQLELTQVRAIQQSADDSRWAQAIEDAKAYNAPELVTRFSDAADQPLTQQNHPLLVQFLDRLVVEMTQVADHVKRAKESERDRPYVEDRTITACNTGFLDGTKSFPSGHAMNGYVASVILAEVIPGHERKIRERGIRYGDNRVVCGVHHQSDVAAGRNLGIAYLEVVRIKPTFQDDLRCARQEEQFLEHTPGTTMSDDCAARRKALLEAMKKS